jgi:hypothetical protein
MNRSSGWRRGIDLTEDAGGNTQAGGKEPGCTWQYSDDAFFTALALKVCDREATMFDRGSLKDNPALPCLNSGGRGASYRLGQVIDSCIKLAGDISCEADLRLCNRGEMRKAVKTECKILWMS